MLLPGYAKRLGFQFVASGYTQAALPHTRLPMDCLLGLTVPAIIESSACNTGKHYHAM